MLTMRAFYTIVFFVFLAAVVIFAVQNLTTVGVSFLGFSIQAPMALIIAAVYVVGMLTGSSLFAALRNYLRPKAH
ncbi:hypothetical protein RDV64_05490 [Acuticoccus sp. MNP-M23]|uniref:hypothetical protein n=1 Tax=Acuticoccus sp. MNP-M23 TaxID=3072793 RepID=UPI00281687B2|nr:hypothetical protein [Acuticoccus sp. MNP-M23]WMS43851.1 hypothetical protein RDV64_05490 [Acuticoccus sp. MNP-M23]